MNKVIRSGDNIVISGVNSSVRIPLHERIDVSRDMRIQGRIVMGGIILVEAYAHATDNKPFNDVYDAAVKCLIDGFDNGSLCNLNQKIFEAEEVNKLHD